MKKDNNSLKAFLDWLKNNDRTEEEKMQCKLLDEYMKTRDNLPGRGITGTELVEDHTQRLLQEPWGDDTGIGVVSPFFEQQ